MTLTLTNREKRWGWLFLILQIYLIPNGCAFLCAALGIRSGTIVNLLAFFANAALVPVFFGRLLAQSVRNARWGRTLLTVLTGFGSYWLLSILTSTLIFFLDPGFDNVNDAGVNAMIDEAPLFMSLAVVFAAPLAEEFLFRGWIFTSLAERSIPLAYTVTAVFFSAAHIAGYVGYFDVRTLLLCFLQYLGPSIVLCRTCQKADSLLAPLALHMTINTIALFVTR